MPRNPFFFNVLWMVVVAAATLLCMLYCALAPLGDHIVTGLFYSAVILLLNEIAQYFRDKRSLGLLAGEYERIEQYEKIEKGLRAEELSAERQQQLRASGKEPMHGTNYTKFNYGLGPAWTIQLIYEHGGLYNGTAQYPQYWGDKKESTEVEITLKLEDGTNAGSGTYSYSDRNDYGVYSFQIREQDLNKIIVTYQNVVPNGIAEGYEVWQKRQARHRKRKSATE
jgi:hypothetical protein